ncbi:MAG: hypothetical protein ACXVNN_02785 [Bacteroidia bacterium]
MKIGFIGGCINNPAGIKDEEIYRNLLKNRLPELSMSFSTYHVYSGLIKKTELLIDKNKPDTLFVFVRNFPYLGLNKPLIKLMGGDKKTFYKFHPALLKRSNKTWPEEYDQFVERFSGQQFPIRRYFAMRDINLLSGIAIGLHRWALAYVNSILEYIHSLCMRENIKLVIIGPLKNPETFTGEIISSYLNKKLKKIALKKNIPFLNINLHKDHAGNTLLQEDKIHFGKYGHALLAEKIEKILTGSADQS